MINKTDYQARQSDPDFTVGEVLAIAPVAAPPVVILTPGQMAANLPKEDAADKLLVFEPAATSALEHVRANNPTLPFDVTMAGALALNKLMLELMAVLNVECDEIAAARHVITAIIDHVLHIFPASLDAAFAQFYLFLEHNDAYKKEVEEDKCSQVSYRFISFRLPIRCLFFHKSPLCYFLHALVPFWLRGSGDIDFAVVVCDASVRHHVFDPRFALVLFALRFAGGASRGIQRLSLPIMASSSASNSYSFATALLTAASTCVCLV